MDFSAVNPETFTAANARKSRVTLGGGVLTINGTHRDDRLSVRMLNSQTVRVTFIGVQTTDFDISDVNRVRVIARRGNDSFNNTTSLPTDFFGMDGNDLAYGGSGNDTMNGGPGNDTLEGREGIDRLIGEDGDDILRGGDGNDNVRGGLGNDTVSGGNGNDHVIGDAGDDILVGNAGNDYMWGWLGNDRMLGGTGIDRIFGQQGVDDIDGGSDTDYIRGGDGNDIVNGGAGRDFVYGEAGHDEVIDLSGDNILHGGAGNDILRVQTGNNVLYGNDGNDILQGGNQRDSLYGGNGSDTLIGGANNLNDRLEGGAGVDHILYRPSNLVAREERDINIKFTGAGASWTVAEMRVINRAIEKMHAATNNNRLFKDAITGSDLVFQKVPSLAGGATAVNELSFRTVNGVTTYDRVIKFSDWDESNEPLNGARELVVPHEVGHNFDNDFERSAAGISDTNWTRFISRSGWRETNPNNSRYARSQDGQWWYLRDSEFFRSYSTLNVYEDWSTVWELYFDDSTARPPGGSNLGLKLTEVTNFFRQLRS